MSTSLSLESVKVDFDQWRAQKKSPQCRAPDPLRQKALALRAQHSDKAIIKALGISRERLKSWEVASTATPVAGQNVSTPNPEFIALPLQPREIPAQPEGELNITCEQANGSRWQLQGSFTAEQLHAFVCAVNAQCGGMQ